MKASVSVSLSAQREWQDTPYPGIRYAWLHQSEPGPNTALLQLDQGAFLPRHLHPGWEQIYVISGHIEVNGFDLFANDHIYIGKEQAHEVIAREPSLYQTVSEIRGVTFCDASPSGLND
ncbi:cupin domain-containing protein [Vibrio mangrovi]|uniref:ChrR Cupin-like domain protein n=1 Tax=Vibrio mangrovi TaxID=474394 RepID=A0A1Y6IPT8_9VIBR|nr:cupin domain-containing protein [Vibrio mangrovi]MDW6004400.1 cupin domain-containing protein [Vibrio mangrovi]SMR98800.1 ChrR Cupin-like domain protein [Vibrio mangrovi]